MRRFLAMVIIGCSLTVSCSTDETKEVEETVSQNKLVQFTLRLALPVGDASTRGIDSNVRNANSLQNPIVPKNVENGSFEESKVKDALIVFGKLASGSLSPLKITKVCYLDNFKQRTANYVEWSGMLSVDPGYYRVVVIANPLPEMKSWETIREGADWQAFHQQSIRFNALDELQKIWSDNHFMMTNAFNAHVNEHEMEVVVGKNNIKELAVQRVCARFDYEVNKKDNTYLFPAEQTYYKWKTIDNKGHIAEQDVQVKVQLQEVALTNLSRSFYLVKMFSSDADGIYPTPYDKETLDNYVMDTDWKNKKNGMSLGESELKNMFFYSSESTSPSNVEMLQYTALPVSETSVSRLFYATENTIPGVQRQINKLSTGLVFKGTFAVQKVEDPSKVVGTKDLYYYKNGTSYCLTESPEIVKSDLNLTDDKVLSDNAELAKLGVRKYTKNSNGDYSVWYTYWNRHNDNKEPHKMGIMEFAVVRNNKYVISVNSINVLGNPKEPTGPENPWRPDGNTPDEEWPELDVKFKVSDWVSRSIDFEI